MSQEPLSCTGKTGQPTRYDDPRAASSRLYTGRDTCTWGKTSYPTLATLLMYHLILLLSRLLTLK